MSDTDNNAAFDFESFIRGTQLPRRTVSAYRVDHRDEINRLTAEHDSLPGAAGDEREVGGSSKRADVAKRIVALRDEMETSRVRVRHPHADAAGVQRPSRTTTTWAARPMEMPSVSPKLTDEQWKRLGEAIGSGQWAELVKAANELVLKRVAVPDFSRSVSATLTPPASFES